MTIKDRFERLQEGVSDIVNCHFCFKLFADRSDLFALETTGDDVIKPMQICVTVDGCSVGGNVAAAVNT